MYSCEAPLNSYQEVVHHPHKSCAPSACRDGYILPEDWFHSCRMYVCIKLLVPSPNPPTYSKHPTHPPALWKSACRGEASHSGPASFLYDLRYVVSLTVGLSPSHITNCIHPFQVPCTPVSRQADSSNNSYTNNSPPPHPPTRPILDALFSRWKH